MVMAVSNAPLLVNNMDISGLPNQFRDGQKLRQEHEARQQQKALNEIMKVGDHNGRLELAQQHKYAGALVPQLQKYEEDRQKAALDNLKTSADIGKVYGETGKLGAETGEIGVKTQGQTIKNMTDKYSQISAGALTQNPQYFALMLGDFQNAGLINPEQKGAVIDMMMKDPENAAKVMQQLARGTIEGFKATAPTTQVTDTGDKKIYQTVDAYTGKYSEPYQQVTLGESPNNFGTRTSGENNNIRTTNASVANNQYTVDAGERNNIRTTDAQTYKAELDSKDRVLKLDQDGKIGWAKVSQEQQKLDNPQANRKPIPPSAMKEMGKLQQNLVSNAQTMTENGKWMKRLQSGELQLGAVQNFGNTAAARTGITSLGSNPEAYAEFNAYIKDLANKALRLNAGVQTDADYKRQLEAIVSGGGIPKDNGIAFGLLNRIHKDFDSQNRGIYQNLAGYKKEYAGVDVPAYSQNKGKKSTASNPSKPSQGASIIRSIGGG